MPNLRTRSVKQSAPGRIGRAARIALLGVTFFLFAQRLAVAQEKPGNPPPSPAAPEFHFQVATDAAGNVRQVLVFRGNTQTQALDICTDKAVSRENGLGDLDREDFNFDGYPDLMLRVSRDPSTHNSHYCVWLYEPATQTFVFSAELSRLTNPTPDPKSKTVIAHRNIACSEKCFVEDSYAWSSGQLVPVREVSLSEDPVVGPGSDCRWVWEVKQRKKGRLVDVRRDRVDVGGVMCEPHFGP